MISNRVMVEEHFMWAWITLEWVFNKAKYLKLIFPPLPLPTYIPQGVGWNLFVKQVS